MSKFFQIIFVFAIIFSHPVFGQKTLYPAVIQYTDGTVEEVEAEVPNQPKTLQIWVKKKNEKKAKITSSSSISKILFTTGEEKHLFEYLETQQLVRKTLKKASTKSWLVLSYGTKKLNVYSLSQTYSIGARGVLVENSLYTHGNLGITFYYKKPNDNIALEVYEHDPDFEDLKSYRRAVAYYLNDCPQAIAYTKSRKFRWNYLYKTAALYSVCEK